jgi:hypothetical protein
MMSTDVATAGPIARIAALPRETVLRLTLRVDAIVTGANGLAYLAAAGALDSVLGVPAGFLRGIGAFLIVFALGVWAISARPTVGRGAVVAVVAANAAWAATSVVFAVADWHTPTVGGTVWTLLQAVTVGGFAAAQLWALRRLG